LVSLGPLTSSFKEDGIEMFSMVFVFSGEPTASSSGLRPPFIDFPRDFILSAAIVGRFSLAGRVDERWSRASGPIFFFS